MRQKFVKTMWRWRALAAALSALTSLCGCAMKKVAPPPPPFANQLGDARSDRLEESLFKGDQALLSNQDIDRILTARITLGDRHRLALLRLNFRNFWDSEIAELEVANSENLRKALKTVPQLTQVQFVPTLLVPEKRTIPYLREAAARFQADLLLVYETRVRTFQHTRLIGTDEVQAEAIVEGVLLDVRSGIVIHAAQAAEGISAKKAAGDLNFAQTVAKSQVLATGRALVQLADHVVTFMNASEQ